MLFPSISVPSLWRRSPRPRTLVAYLGLGVQMGGKYRSEIPEQEQRVRRLRLPTREQLKRSAKWVAAAVGFLAAVAALAAFALQLMERKSNVDTLAITAEMYGTAYAVPLDAPFADFPTTFVPSKISETWESCSPEQIAWLERYGDRVVEFALVTMRNTAESGALLTVEAFTTQGTLRPDSTHVRMQCNEPLGGTIQTQLSELTTDTASKAQFVERPGGGPTGAITYTLMPGETAQTQIWVRSDRRNEFEGSLTARVVSGQKTKTVTVGLGGSGPFTPHLKENRFTLSPWAVTEELLVGIGRRTTEPKLFDCVERDPWWSSTGGGEPCDPDELIRALDSFDR